MRRIPLPLGAALIVLLASAAAAQSIADQRRQMGEAQAAAAAASARAAALQKRAAAERDEAARTRAEAAALAGKVQAAEADIAAARARLALIDRLRRAQRARLAAKQEPAVKLVAALQTMTRRPPALALVQPGSLDDIVHVRAVMATMLPAIRERTAGLRAEAERGRRLRSEAARTLAALEAGQRRLEERRTELARLEAAQRRRSRMLGNAGALEGERALALGERARDLGALMRELEQDADVRASLASLPGPLPRPPQPDASSAPPPAEASAAPERLPPYRLPVIGRVVAGFGELSRSGVHSRGLTIATAPRAQVVAPMPGRVAFAGPYRGYGSIVIVDHGGGLTSLIAGLGDVAVAVGATVDQGSPLGRAPATRPEVTVELRRGGEPVDIGRIIS